MLQYQIWKLWLTPSRDRNDCKRFADVTVSSSRLHSDLLGRLNRIRIESEGIGLVLLGERDGHVGTTTVLRVSNISFMPYIVPSYWHWKPTTAEVSELVSCTTSIQNNSKVISVPFFTPFTINLPGVVVAMRTADFSSTQARASSSGFRYRRMTNMFPLLQCSR